MPEQEIKPNQNLRIPYYTESIIQSVLRALYNQNILPIKGTEKEHNEKVVAFTSELAGYLKEKLEELCQKK